MPRSRTSVLGFDLPKTIGPSPRLIHTVVLALAVSAASICAIVTLTVLSMPTLTLLKVT